MKPDELKQHYLRRLPPEFYRGQAYVHWSMTIEERKTGWLVPVFYYKFREILTHTMFRYGLVCPIYCCMPDHIHLLWMGVLDTSDQLNAAKFFRKHINSLLEKLGAKFQQQSYDHVLCEDERQETAFKNTVEYIARNPERAGLVEPDAFHEYKYAGCLIPGYPQLTLWEPDFWSKFWRIYQRLRIEGFTRGFEE